MRIDLSGKVAVVTGASRGIGKAIYAQLKDCGCTVVGTATTDAGAAKMENGAVLNVADPSSIEQFHSHVQEQYGAAHILVNNAGVTKDNLLLRMKDEDWQQVIETNLTSIYRLSKLFVRSMIKGRWGRIINIGSVVGSNGNPGQANYAASKAGVCGFSRSLAAEIGSRGITVNVIAPGFFETDMTNALPQAQVDALLAMTPAGRLGQAPEIGYLAAFLASDFGAFITGQTLHVNGGMFMD